MGSLKSTRRKAEVHAEHAPFEIAYINRCDQVVASSRIRWPLAGLLDTISVNGWGFIG